MPGALKAFGRWVQTCRMLNNKALKFSLGLFFSLNTAQQQAQSLFQHHGSLRSFTLHTTTEVNWYVTRHNKIHKTITCLRTCTIATGLIQKPLWLLLSTSACQGQSSSKVWGGNNACWGRFTCSWHVCVKYDAHKHRCSQSAWACRARWGEERLLLLSTQLSSTSDWTARG